MKNYIEANNLGVCFFSPIKHGLLTGKYTQPVSFKMGDFRATKKEFADQMVIEKMKTNKEKLEKRFSNPPQPGMHGVVDALLTGVETGCVLLGQRK
ncbi:MAG: hypothetical protein Ct9H300mP29_1540 [Candidatus Neomarinimicrobiota bacterium]|nr:MAG: hypothetical protein Ct9H300mP29_1540 [Candidatus Neomarinimicrobiota bacterium]